MKLSVRSFARTAATLAIVLILSALSACSTTINQTFTPTEGLTHGINGRFHVLLGSAQRVGEACRSMGADVEFGQSVQGCYLQAGQTHWMWAVQNELLADTVAHEWRHSIEGAFHLE